MLRVHFPQTVPAPLISEISLTVVAPASTASMIDLLDTAWQRQTHTGANRSLGTRVCASRRGLGPLPYHSPMQSDTKLLLASAAGAANTVNAYRPLARRPPASIPAFVASAATTEFPLQAITCQQLSAIGFALRGALSSRKGRLGLALSAASWAGLANLYREAARSEQVLEAALIDGLGSGYRSRIVAPRFPPAEARLSRAQIALPRRGYRRRYLRLADESYGEFGKANHLDIWRRADLPVDAMAPVVLQIPGGGWVMGGKTGQAYPLLSHLAERGWVCVAMNYRLGPRSVWPAQIADVKQAIAWIKSHIGRHGGIRASSPSREGRPAAT